MKKISFVIPCYGSEHTIENVVNEIRQTVTKRSEYDYEIILVNDYSPDHVWDKITELTREDPHVKGLFLAKILDSIQRLWLVTGNRMEIL